MEAFWLINTAKLIAKESTQKNQAITTIANILHLYDDIDIIA